MNPSAHADEQRLSFFQIVVLVLTIVVLASMLADAVVELPTEANRILQSLDLLVCGLLIIDFSLRFYHAENKRLFIRWGWIDLIASIPTIDFLRWARLVRILRVIRIIRAVRSYQKVHSLVLRNKLKNGVGAVVLSSCLLIIFASVAILMFESHPDSNIKTAEDAVWWSVTTITTVGYGDKFPLTLEGRVIAMLLMISGVGLFGTLSGLIASAFLGTKREPAHNDELLIEVKCLRMEIARLQRRENVESEIGKEQ
ncbi:MAG: potassium channel family protein [Verrucomicrobia bacterium]|nr:potassium channel family protein [Verrucomicrobiota bacterium]